MPTESQLHNSVEELLKNVEDPEIGINIIDLGLVYAIDISPNGIFLTVTLTSVACPLQEYIEEDITRVLSSSEETSLPIYINWVFSPMWVPTMMTEEGKDMFLAIGGHIPSY